MKKSDIERQYQVVTSLNGEKILADRVNLAVGSGSFILIQTIVIVAYILWQTITPSAWHFDGYSFAFLMMILSLQAAYTGPFIVWSQNRAAERDQKVMAYIRDAVYHIQKTEDSYQEILKKNEELSERIFKLENEIKNHVTQEAKEIKAIHRDIEGR